MNTNKWIRNQLTNGIILAEQYLEKMPFKEHRHEHEHELCRIKRTKETENQWRQRERETPLLHNKIRFVSAFFNSENIFVPIAEPNKKEFNGTYFIISFVLLFSFTLIAMLYSYVLAMWTK